MIEIIPAILPRNKAELEEKLRLVWGNVNRVQLDIVDGEFAEAKTVGPEVLAEIDTIVRWDVHLMVDKPEEWLGRCVDGGVDRVFGQVERMVDKNKFIADAQSMGMYVGLAYDIDTPLDGFEDVSNDLDAVLLMAVKAGAQGREFDKRVLEKIKLVRKIDKDLPIVVDGGLDMDNIIKSLAAEWAEEMAEEELNRSFVGMEFVVGSELWKAEDVLRKLEELRGNK